mmetsp:Transcript_29458/g.29076  ORF Transcript_29458/g.29076 Transcript_29458/m.29076 type:complete len:166 (+) Transcript_29458:578-1075(+)
MNKEMARQLQNFIGKPVDTRQRNHENGYQHAMPSRAPEYPNHSQMPPNMANMRQNSQYAMNGYDHNSRERHHNGTKQNYMPDDYAHRMRKYGVMNGDPNQISNRLNRENSSNYNHPSHYMSNSNYSSSLDLARNQGPDPRHLMHERMDNFSREREQSTIHGSIDH